MNILLLAPFLPRPDAPSGNPRAVFDRARLLSTAHKVTVATFIEPDEKSEVGALRALGIKVYGVMRNPPQSASRLALWRKRIRLALGLVDIGKPMLVQEFYHPRMSRLLSRLLRREDFDVILVEHILMAQYIDGPDSPKPPVVLTEHDVGLSFPREGKPQERTKPEGVRQIARAALGRYERMRWKRYETRQCRHADVVLVPSLEDAAVLAREVPGLKPGVVPFSIAPALRPSPLPPRVGQSGPGENNPGVMPRHALLFVGNYEHPPNVDAALWLCGEIMPLVWEARPQVELWLVGKNPTREVLALAGKRVTVTGEVASVEPYLRQCAVFVAPLRLGGGMRIKLLEAMGAGAAVITTKVGAQGLNAAPGQHILVADDAPAFASSILQLLSNTALRDRLRSAGQALVASGTSEKERLHRLNAILQRFGNYELLPLREL